MNGLILSSILKIRNPRLVLRYSHNFSSLSYYSRVNWTEKVSVFPLQPARTILRLCSNQSNHKNSDLPPCTSVTPPHTHSTQSESLFDVADIQIPDPPTTCCMSGCANCVWIEYAKELASIYKDGGQAAEKVMNAIDDPNLKIFLSLELQEALKK